jgi:O-antigen ligase
VLGVTFLRQTKRRVLYIGTLVVVALVAVPLLPASFTTRMNTIQGYKADSSASTRIAVWQWTIAYAKDHPFGGGFEAYRQNKLRIVKQATTTKGEQQDVSSTVEYDQARAYHSAYFEMLGEQGYPGLALWLVIHISGLLRMEVLRARYRKSVEDGWIAGLAVALQQGHLIYLIGSLFVGIAFQPFVYMLVGLQIGLDTYAARRAKEAKALPGFGVARKTGLQPG